MELYGSLLNISGSVTASTFTGSFIGDGSGLSGIQASGVTGLNLSQIGTGSVSASLTPNGFNVNTDTSITGSLNVSGTVVSQTTTLVSSSIQVDITGTTGYSTFSSSIATTDLNQENRLTALETSSGSLNSFTSSINTTIKDKLNTENVISSSAQILSNSNIVSSSAQVTEYGFATTGSNLFKGTQTHSGSILPSVDNAYDLGSPTYQWRDVYISSGSLYIDGTKVLSSTAQELTITTDTGQSIKILEGTTDSIILQTADGDIELKSSADGDILLDPTNGKIMLKGPVEILTGQKIQSSVGGTPVVFANDIVVSGSIDLTGTIDGIDLTAFSSSVNTRVGNLETSTGSLNEFTSSTNSRLTSIETSTGSLNTYTGSNDTIINTLQTATSSLNTYTGSNTTNINAIHTATSSLNTFTSSINTTIKSKLDEDGVISGSSQVILTGTTGYSTFSSSVATSVNDLSSSINSLNSTDTSHNNRLDTIEGRYATTGSNVFIGDQTITGSLYISQNLIVQGSSSLENITASAVSIGTNTIILNSDTPAIRYAGISVFDSGSTSVTASLFYDSLTNNWKFKHSDVGTDDASILLFGPLGTGIDNAPTLVGNFLTKVEDDGHGHHLTTSSVFDNGSKISLKNNTEITGSLIVTSTIVSQGTTLVSGSGQISYAGITNVPSGIVSGSGQVSFTGITDKPALVSGSSQVSFNGIADKPALVSGSSQISFNGITDKPTLVSGSSQILDGTTIHSGSFFNGITVVSGSSQISFNGITDKPTLVSGSSQITFGSISSIPGGLVSGSSQIDLTATTNYSTGIKTRLNAEGVISGSSQVTGISNSQLTNSSFNIGTTLISLGRASSSQTLTGVSIDGNATSETLSTVTGRGASTSSTITSTINGTAFVMNGGASAEGISMQASNNTTYPVFLRSRNPTGGGETSAWLFKEESTPWGIWHNNPVNTFDFTRASTTGIENNVGGGTNTVMIRLSASDGSGQFTGNILNRVGTTILDQSGNVPGTSSNITAFTINQSVGTGNGVRFATLQVGSTNTNGGLVNINGGANNQFNLTYSSSAWGLLMGYGDGTNNSGGYHGLNHAAIINVQSGPIHLGTANTSNVQISTAGHFHPSANNTYDCGTSSLAWRNVYTNDLHLSNMNKPEGNDVDGTNGNWTIQEGAENLYIINNNNGKKFKISLEEII